MIGWRFRFWHKPTYGSKSIGKMNQLTTGGVVITSKYQRGMGYEFVCLHMYIYLSLAIDVILFPLPNPT